MSPKESPASLDMSPAAVMARAAAARGDMFPEWQPVADALPETVATITRTGGYLHKYEGQGSDDQELSLQMRELIATPAICNKGDMRHSPNHVRRMYRMGMTNRVILEGALAFAVTAGWATMVNVSLAIMEANSADYPFGELPAGGEPKNLKPFPELEQGRTRVSGTGEGMTAGPDWQLGKDVDPELVVRLTGWAEHCLPPDGGTGNLLGTGPRELIVVAGLCIRGEVERAARHIRHAYDWGMTPRQVLEAISATIPMTGFVTAEIGLEAMRKAGLASR